MLLRLGESCAHESFHVVVHHVVDNIPFIVFEKSIVSGDQSLDPALAAWLPTVGLVPDVARPVFHSIVVVPDQLNSVVSIREGQFEKLITLLKVVGGSDLRTHG